MKSTDRESPPDRDPGSETPGSTVLAFFLLALVATAPSLLLLGLVVLPRLGRLEEATERMEDLLERVEGVANLSYFSRDPSRSSLQEALAHLRFWADQETKARAFEIPDTQKRQEMAVSALIAAGPTNLGLLEEEALRLDLGPGAKYYRRALMRVLTQIDPERAGSLAARLLTEGDFEPQTRLFAAEELLGLSEERAVRAMRQLLESNDHLSLDGYPNLLGFYIHQVPDPTKGGLLQRILERPTLDLATLMEIIKGLPDLPRTDPAVPLLAQDLEAIYLRPDTVRERFQSTLLLRPHAASMLPTVRLAVVRTLGAVLPRPELADFLDQAERVETDLPTLGTISRLRQERGL